MDLAAIFNAAFLNGVGVVGVVFLVGLLVMRGHLIPGRTHREFVGHAREQIDKAEKRADRWEAVALRTLEATERLAEPVDVAAKVLTTIPRPEESS